jgi:hypothetical protein
MGKFIIEESEKRRILSLYKKLIKEYINNDKEDIILTYTNFNKWKNNIVYINGNKLDYNGHTYTYCSDIIDILRKLNNENKLGKIFLVGKNDPDNIKYEVDYDYLINRKTCDQYGLLSIPFENNNTIKNLPLYVKKFGNELEVEEPIKPEIINIVSKPISNRDVINEMNRTIKESISSIYKNKNTWSIERDGVVNIYTLEEYGIEDDNWSVLNYFNSSATPKRIKELFIKNTNINPGESQENLDKLKEWIVKNKFILFTNKGGKAFEELLSPQVAALLHGKHNENKAYKFIDKLIVAPNIPSIINTISEKFSEYRLLPQEKAGSKLDRSGVDMTLVNKNNPEDKIYFQAKPNTGVDIIKNSDNTISYRIKSSSVYNLDRIPKTNYFIFVSDLEWKNPSVSKKRGVICFENIKDGFKIDKNDGHHITFNYPPVFWDPNY